MKRILLTTTLALAFMASQAAVLTLDNNLDSGAQYDGIGAAVSAANPGDTILVHASQYSYGNYTLTKQVAIIGPGHNPEVTSGLPAQFGIITVNNGSDGSIFEGLLLAGVHGGLWNSANTITVRNCSIISSSWISSNYGDGSNSDGWIIEGNVMQDNSACGGCKLINVNASAGSSDNWIFRNNYMRVQSSSNRMFDNLNATATFSNNFILYPTSNNLFEDSQWAMFENNIFWVTSSNLDVSAGCETCIFNNNLFYNPNGDLTEVDGENNVWNQDPMFEGVNGTVIFDYLDNFQLAAGSPASTAAADGGELGFYGGAFIFRMDGFPADNPRITHTTPQFISVPLDTPFTIEFGAKRSGL